MDTILPIQTATSDPISTQDHIQNAFQITEPVQRREAVLLAVQQFLNDPSVRAMTDEEASTLFTETAFSSERLVLPDAGYIARDGGRAVVGLLDGMGLYLYDLDHAASQPVLLSPWTVGLVRLEVYWESAEIGVQYDTLGNDDILRAHFVLAVEADSGWKAAWISDEAPDWWFNAQNATLSVAPDLSWIAVTGEASGTTLVFDEQPGHPRRAFHLEWIREGESFKPTSSPHAYDRREAWLWSIATPSPYATLVEFLERLQMGDAVDVETLVSNPAVIRDAAAFGLDLIGRRFEVVTYEPDQIVFRDLQGTFVATFREEPSAEYPWLISSIAPLGAEP